MTKKIPKLGYCFLVFYFLPLPVIDHLPFTVLSLVSGLLMASQAFHSLLDSVYLAGSRDCLWGPCFSPIFNTMEKDIYQLLGIEENTPYELIFEKLEEVKSAYREVMEADEDDIRKRIDYQRKIIELDDAFILYQEQQHQRGRESLRR